MVNPEHGNVKNVDVSVYMYVWVLGPVLVEVGVRVAMGRCGEYGVHIIEISRRMWRALGSSAGEGVRRHDDVSW